jgi:hypothetical protein
VTKENKTDGKRKKKQKYTDQTPKTKTQVREMCDMVRLRAQDRSEHM